MTRLFFLISLTIFFTACNAGKNSSERELDYRIQASFLHECNIVLESAIVNDYFPPPVASRIYVYPNIAAYECLQLGNDGYSSLNAQYNYTDDFPQKKEKVNLEIAALYAFYFTGRELVYSSDVIDSAVEKLTKKLGSEKLSKGVLETSKKFGMKVAKQVLNWAKKDAYNEMRSFAKYSLETEPNKWEPTPPEYMDALEPHWSKLRPFCLDSSSQFKPTPPTEFSLSENSLFYAELDEVYNAVNKLNEEQIWIAKFWDCNPIVPMHRGHITFSEKKLTPGGHWVNIGRNAMKKKDFSLIKTAASYVTLTVAIHDAFISCWDEKYRSNYIRPVTVIQKHIDPEWSPILLTPNFPEYPSGHSVVSSSASMVLTNIFGENYSFIDSTEVPYGMEPRAFESFFAASNEAAISRMYGGIHFKPAIDNGIVQGKKVGKHVLNTLKLEK